MVHIIPGDELRKGVPNIDVEQVNMHIHSMT